MSAPYILPGAQPTYAADAYNQYPQYQPSYMNHYPVPNADGPKELGPSHGKTCVSLTFILVSLGMIILRLIGFFSGYSPECGFAYVGEMFGILSLGIGVFAIFKFDKNYEVRDPAVLDKVDAFLRAMLLLLITSFVFYYWGFNTCNVYVSYYRYHYYYDEDTRNKGDCVFLFIHGIAGLITYTVISFMNKKLRNHA